MAIVIGTATVNVRADTSGFRGQLSGLTGHITGLFSKIGSAVAALGLAHLAREAIAFGGEYRKQLDEASVSIQNLVGNQTDAADLMERMTKMAIQTPFDLPGITKATTMMLSYGASFGVTSDNVLDWVNTLGNAAAATGKSSTNMLNVITTMGKISGQGRIMTRDMNQLTANFPSLHPWELLSEMTGKTQAELRKLAAKPGGLSGIVDTTEFIHRLKTEMENLPGAANAMETRLNTLGGAFEQFKDAMGVALAEGLKPFFDGLMTLMKDPAITTGLADLIASFGSFISVLTTGLTPVLPTLLSGVEGIMTALQPLAPLVGTIALVFGNLMTAVAPVLGTLADAVVQLMPSFVQLVTAINPLIRMLGEMLPGAMDVLLPVFEGLVDAVSPLIPMIGGAFLDAISQLLPLFAELVSAITPLIPVFAQAFLSVMRQALPVFSQLITLITPLIPVIGSALLSAVQKLAPVFLQLVKAVLPLIPIFGDTLVSVLDTLVPILTNLMTAIEPLIPVLGEALASAVQQLLPFITQLAAAITPVIPLIGQALIDAVMQLLPPIIQLAEALTPLIPMIGQLLVAALQILIPILTPLIDLLAQVASQLVDGLAPVIPIVIQVVQELAAALQPLIAAFADHLAQSLQAVIPLLPPLAELLLAVLDAVLPILPPMIELTTIFLEVQTTIINVVVPALVLLITWFTFVSDKLGWLIDKVAAFVGAVTSWFHRLISGTIGPIADWVKGIIQFFQNLADKLVGHSIIPDMVNAILRWFDKLTAPIQAVLDAIMTAVEAFGDGIKTVMSFTGLIGAVSAVWNGVKSAITGPIQAAYDVVANTVGKIKSAVQGAIDKVSSIPGGGLLGKIPGLAAGGIVEHPTLAVLGEQSRREAVIPLTNPGRAMQLMQQSGLDRLAAQIGTNRGLTGPLVTMPGAVIQDATDADLVAQRTMVALTATLAA